MNQNVCRLRSFARPSVLDRHRVRNILKNRSFMKNNISFLTEYYELELNFGLSCLNSIPKK